MLIVSMNNFYKNHNWKIEVKPWRKKLEFRKKPELPIPYEMG